MAFCIRNRLKIFLEDKSVRKNPLFQNKNINSSHGYTFLVGRSFMILASKQIVLLFSGSKDSAFPTWKVLFPFDLFRVQVFQADLALLHVPDVLRLDPSTSIFPALDY